jgi:fumarate hydratase, class II
VAKKKTRIERDSMGEVQVPVDALYAAQTQRAVENFPISGIPMPARFIHAICRIKGAAARVNADLGLLERGIGSAIETSSPSTCFRPAPVPAPT